jgi:hypothetical protein
MCLSNLCIFLETSLHVESIRQHLAGCEAENPTGSAFVKSRESNEEHRLTQDNMGPNGKLRCQHAIAQQ